MISKDFIRSSLVYSIAGALPLLSGFLLLPFFTNLLSTSDYGNLALLFALSALLQLLFNVGLDATIGVHYFHLSDDESHRNTYIATVFSGLLITGTIWLVLLLVSGPSFFQLLFRQHPVDFYNLGVATVLTSFLNSYSKTYTNLMINRQKRSRFLWINVTGFIVTVAVSISWLWLRPYDITGPVVGRLAGALVSATICAFYSTREYGWSFSKPLFIDQLRFSIPLFGYFVVLWAASFLDRYVLNSFMQPADVGVFDFTVKCIAAIEVLQLGLASAINPRVFALLQERGNSDSAREVTRYFSGFTAVFLLLLPLMAFSFPALIPVFVFNKDYYGAFVFLPVVCAAYSFRGLFNLYQAPLLYFKKTHRLFFVFLIAVLLQLPLTIWFVWLWGLPGACLALPLTRVTQVILLRMEWRKEHAFDFNTQKLIWLPCAYSLLACVTPWLVGESGPRLFLWNAVVLVTTWTLIAFFYKHELATLWQKLRTR